jgi:hypothetical protein
MAGDENRNGFLPSLEDMAFILRIGTEELETDLNELVRIGILEFKNERYFVRKFSKRQKPMPKAEYMRRKRAETKSEEHYNSLPPRDQDVTDGNTESDTDTDKDVDRIDIDGEEPNPDGIYAELSIAFCNKTKIPELTGGPNAWYESLTKMGDAGVIPEDIEKAVDILRDKGYSIVRLSSIENTAIGEMSKRKGTDMTSEEYRSKYVTGEYEEFIEH